VIYDWSPSPVAVPEPWGGNLGIKRSALKVSLLAAMLTTVASFSSAAEDTIGPLDGVLCDVVATEEVFRPAAECGFNDLGVPILGEYTKESRICKRYDRGEELSSWDDTRETFKECHSP
jgi:hypothetical protein